MSIFRLTIGIFYLCLVQGSKNIVSLINTGSKNFCITNSSSDAMYYTTISDAVRTEELSFLPNVNEFCDFETTACMEKFKIAPWFHGYSLNHENPPLLDYRWERLKVQELPSTSKRKGKEKLEFLTLLELHNRKYFKVPMSLLGEEVHFLLCDRKEVEQANCYWFALQGWTKKFTAMRKCRSGEIVGTSPEGYCKKRMIEKKHPEDLPLFINTEEWRHIIIERSENRLFLKTYSEGKEETVIDYLEKDEQMFQLNYLMGHRKVKSAFCKVHENNYMQSTEASDVIFNNFWPINARSETCFSILLNTCQYCLTTVIILGQNEVQLSINQLPPTNGVWEEHKIMLNLERREDIRIEMVTTLGNGIVRTGREFWSFDNFRDCHKEEYRTTPFDPIDKVSECRLLTNGQIVKLGEVINDISDNTCLPGTIGSQCISCSILKQGGIKNCRSMKICEKHGVSNVCYCSPGFKGSECNKECPSGSYGHLCQEKCGYCAENRKCDIVDGSCFCSYLFEPPICKIPKDGQYLTNPPKVLHSTAQSCAIQWNSSDFVGKNEPKYYQIQYTEYNPNNVVWNNYEEAKEIDDDRELREVVIGQLKKNKKYGIRVLISNKKRTIEALKFVSLPFENCKTTCNGWTEDDIVIEPNSTSAKISIKLTEDKCEVASYVEYVLKNEKDETLLSGRVKLIFLIPALEPTTKYRIVFVSTSHNVSKPFTTLEGVPSVVGTINMEISTDSYMKINWEVPKNPNGEIKGYTLKVQKLRRLSCKFIQSSVPFENSTDINSIELHFLEPYSLYEITIWAFNNRYNGEVSSAQFETKGLDYFKNEENFDQISGNISPVETSASIQFQNIQCEKLLGPLKYSVEFSCISKWCLKTEIQSATASFPEKDLIMEELQPYSEYEYVLSFCRNENHCLKNQKATFTTKDSVPNETKDVFVISMGLDLDKGVTFIWIRWSPPYPPTGSALNHKITTTCVDCRWKKYPLTVPIANKECLVWKGYFCHKIQYDNSYYRNTFSVEIEAANVENGKYRKIAHIPSIKIEEKPSEPPYDCSAFVNKDNTLEVFWNHPNATNGILKNFTIEINNYQDSRFSIGLFEFKMKYNYKITEPLPPATDLSIRIYAYNNKYRGVPAELKNSTYPVSPDLVNSTINIVNSTKSTISIALNIAQVETSSANVIKYMFVLVEDHLSDTKDANMKTLEKVLEFETKSSYRVVEAKHLNSLSSNYLTLTIGDGGRTKETDILKSEILNNPLQEAEYYNISILMINMFRDKNRYTMYNLTLFTSGDPTMTTPSQTAGPEKKSVGKNDESSGGTAAYAWLLLLLLLLIPIIIGLIMKRKNIVLRRPTISLEKIVETSTHNASLRRDCEEIIPLDEDFASISEKQVKKVKPRLLVRKSTNPPHSPTDLYSKPIKMMDFEEYVKASIENGELERQHALFPRGQTQPCQYGSSKVNKPKNRYNNLTAYDHSRVILEKIDGDDYSDYINANYIHGYNMDKVYIATQGPKATTLTDFWRMIWQENVKHIVMLANIYEGGKKKVEKYWPNINEELNFQDIVVQYQSMELFANFEYRILHATKGGETREIEQLHFTTWPDHGVPLYPQSLVPFIRKLLKIPLSPTSPIVVHCSAGVGRTGTILLADICLRMAAKQGVVDVLNNLQKLREQRSNMVDNIEQYKLAHLVVLECLTGLRTSIPCDEDMDKNVKKLIRDGDYKVQMNYLIETEWQDQAMKSVADVGEVLPSYPEKDRIREIVPESQGRIFLTRYPLDDESSSYINAVQIDAFRCPGRFIVTQQPMPNTLGDFWRLVTERQISVIISLNEVDTKDRSCCKFWPTADNPELQPVNFILVKYNNVIELEYYDIYSLHVLIKSSAQKLDVQIVALKRWPAKSLLPHSCEELLSFYEEADAISRRSTNVIVTCFNGATASGVYVALSFIIEQMKLEHECDVSLAVRTVRHNRKQFVTDENQFLFLYECAVKFINGFQSYANFQKQCERVTYG